MADRRYTQGAVSSAESVPDLERMPLTVNERRLPANALIGPATSYLSVARSTVTIVQWWSRVRIAALHRCRAADVSPERTATTTGETWLMVLTTSPFACLQHLCVTPLTGTSMRGRCVCPASTRPAARLASAPVFFWRNGNLTVAATATAATRLCFRAAESPRYDCHRGRRPKPTD